MSAAGTKQKCRNVRLVGGIADMLGAADLSLLGLKRPPEGFMFALHALARSKGRLRRHLKSE
jgi:hypothetical protein